MPILTPDEAMQQIRTLDYSDEIARFIEEAQAWVEKHTGHLLESREVTEVIPGLSSPVIHAWPVAPNATVSISYQAADGPVEISGARLDVSRRPARLLPAFGERFPALPSGTSVTVTVTAGYDDYDEVPAEFRRAMLVLIAAYDADREGGAMFAQAHASARNICRAYRLRRL